MRRDPGSRDAAETLATETIRLWGAEQSTAIKGTDRSGISALHLVARGPPRILFSPARGNIHILCYAVKPAESHRLWFDDQLVHDGPIQSGSVSIVPSGREPRAHLYDLIDVLHVNIPHALLVGQATELGFRGTMQSLELINPKSARNIVVEALATSLMQAMATRHPTQILFADYLRLALTSHLLRAHSNFDKLRSAPVRSGLSPSQYKRVTSYMLDRLNQDISLDELAGVAGLSSHYFCRVFKQSTGLPPHRWQTRQRVEHAKTLMLTTGLSLANIAASVGFSDQSHFTTVFRKLIGTPPNAWHRAMRI